MVKNDIGKNAKKRRVGLKDIFLLQAVFIIYSLSSVMSKLASQELDALDSLDTIDSFAAAINTLATMFTPRFILLAGSVVLILGVYAIIWQQLIKRFDLSVAYANKATSLLWALLWGFFIFSEAITLTKVVGVAVVFVGVVLMNSEAVDKREQV